MAGSSLKRRIEENVTVWLLSTLLTGFLAGVGVYRAVQDMAGLKIMSASEIEDSKRQLVALEAKVAAADQRAAAAAAQVRQAYWAIRGTQVNIVYGERDADLAVEIKERLSALGALPTLRPLDREDQRRAGRLYYGEDSRDAAMQVKALVSDLLVTVPEDDVNIRPGVVSLWLQRK